MVYRIPSNMPNSLVYRLLNQLPVTFPGATIVPLNSAPVVAPPEANASAKKLLLLTTVPTKVKFPFKSLEYPEPEIVPVLSMVTFQVPVSVHENFPDKENKLIVC